MRLSLPLLLLPALFAQSASLSPDELRKQVASFDYVWERIRDRHWEKNPGGADWNAVRAELRPKMEAAKTRQEARAILTEMLGRLKQSHFGIISAENYEGLESPDPPGEGTVGLDVRILGDEAVVTKVDAESPAAKAGVKPGWVIARIGEENAGEVVARLRRALKNEPRFELYGNRALLSRLSGDIGSKVTLEFVAGDGKRIPLTLDRVRPNGTLTKFGFIPSLYVQFESRKLPGNIGYMSLNTFFDPPSTMAKFEDAIKSCMGCRGLIFDLRGNPGGIGGMAMGMAGWLVDEPNLFLGTMITRETQLKFVVNPRAETFQGPLAILIDGASASTSEILAGGLKDLGRARIFGTRTAAAALPSAIEKLPNGDGFQFAMANYVSKSGQPLEGIGVAPDVQVQLTKKALLEGRDPVVDAAAEWIQAQSRKK